MGLLDQKERVLDFRLTDKGRERLSKNQLNFSYYAFSDDGIDYSGSISSSVLISGSNLNDFVHINTFAFEPITKNNKSLNNFIFTMPVESEVVTQFNSSVTGSFSLKRNYEIETIENIIKNAGDIEKFTAGEDVLDYVIIIEETPITETDRFREFVTKQINTFTFLTDKTKTQK